MAEWEHCVIRGFKQRYCNYPEITYFTRDGQKTEGLGGTGPDGLREEDRVARLIAQLGEEGWEMVGCVNTSETVHSIYFKRPLPDNS